MVGFFFNFSNEWVDSVVWTGTSVNRRAVRRKANIEEPDEEKPVSPEKKTKMCS